MSKEYNDRWWKPLVNPPQTWGEIMKKEVKDKLDKSKTK